MKRNSGGIQRGGHPEGDVVASDVEVGPHMGELEESVGPAGAFFKGPTERWPTDD
jgi:hypothetical protein